jgi:hypothetical protein
MCITTEDSIVQSWGVLCCAVLAQARHNVLLEQVQQLEVLRKENGEMAALVAQLQVLKNDQAQLRELAGQVEALQADNAALTRKTQMLPGLRAEMEQLKVRGVAGWLQQSPECVLMSKGWLAWQQHLSLPRKSRLSSMDPRVGETA